MYKYGILKPVKIILRRGSRKRIMEGMNQTGCIACIYGNVTKKPLVQLLYTSTNVFKNSRGSMNPQNYQKRPNCNV
jgi:hypothetical protein